MNAFHFSLAVRQLLKNKSVSLLNLLGLSTGMAMAIVIGLYVRKEWMTDRFMRESGSVYRVIRQSGLSGQPYEIGITAPNYGPALRSEFGDRIDTFTRFYPDRATVAVGDKRFSERRFAYADPGFFTFFGLPFLSGDPAAALSGPGNVVLTHKTAEKLFGSAEVAMGNIIRWNNRRDLLVSGVCGDFPTGSHLEFDYLAPLSLFEREEWFGDWWNNNLCTYIRMAPGADATALNASLPRFMDKYFGKDFAEQGSRIELRLQPWNEIYWNNEPRYDPVRHGNATAVRIFGLAALFLLAVACFNFINLSTARASERSREVGVKKALGAGRVALGSQFLLESYVLVTVAALLALGMAAAAIPAFNRYFGLELSLAELGWKLLLWLSLLIAGTGFLAGFYPAALLSGYKPVSALKKMTALSTGALGLRRALTVAQFALCITLMVGTLVAYRQLAFLKEAQLGFNRENVVLMETYGTDVRREKLFEYQNRIAQYPGVLQQTVSDVAPGNTPDASTLDVGGRTDHPKINVLFADFQFRKALDIPLVAGRDFDPNLSTDTTRAVLLNEAACRTLGVSPEQALGMELTPVYFDSLRRRVVGVVRDYHFMSLRDRIAPLLIVPHFRFPGTLAVRVAPGALPRTLQQLERDWAQIDPAHAFEYRMLDDRLDELYKAEEKQGRLFGLFSLAAILVAGLGMFGLASLLTTQRTKEIGIRKVLGASAAGLTQLLAGDFVRLVLLAFLIATPVAWKLMQSWLLDFAYRIDLSWWFFAVAGLSAIAVAYVAVGYQSLRAALANPVKSLRSE